MGTRPSYDIHSEPTFGIYGEAKPFADAEADLTAELMGSSIIEAVFDWELPKLVGVLYLVGADLGFQANGDLLNYTMEGKVTSGRDDPSGEIYIRFDWFDIFYQKTKEKVTLFQFSGGYHEDTLIEF